METRLTKWTFPSNYMGEEWPEYYVFLSQTRDSDCLTRSNFACALEAIGGELTADDDTPLVCVVRESHWACGWVEWIAIHQSATVQIGIAETILGKLADYPVVNEEHFCQLECDEANEIWANCYDQKERIAYIRRNRSQFDFADFADLRATIRGEYFTGYASELIG